MTFDQIESDLVELSVLFFSNTIIKEIKIFEIITTNDIVHYILRSQMFFLCHTSIVSDFPVTPLVFSMVQVLS